MRISFVTLGCKLNQAETNEIRDELRGQGHVIVPFNRPADTAVIRACAVTMNASQTTRELIRQAKKRGLYVIAGGCLENRELPEIDYIAETPGDIVIKCAELNSRFRGNERRYPAYNAVTDRTRALIKIQNGCNFNCTYCVIPLFRGKSKSVAAGDIIKKISQANHKGFKEITLTGVNICQYRSGRNNLSGLLKLVLKKTRIERIRLGSLDPRLITPDLIAVYVNPRLMPHWHLSLQSGSDNVLKRMNRGYTTKQYINIVKKMRSKYPLFSFTTDIIVGFPGETENEFKETLAFVQKVGFTQIHAFPYSKRPNTPASYIKQVHDKTKTERVAKLIEVADKMAKKYENKLTGKKRPVLFERKKNNYWFGYTPEYTPVKYKSAKNLQNKIMQIKITPV